MNLFLWAATPDLSYATTTLADLQLLIAALDDPSLPANAATIARVTDKIPALVQGDTGEPLVIASYDNATGTVSSWITDAGASVIACLGLADPVGDPLVTATDFSIVGSTRSGVLMLNTITLQQALQRLPARRATSGAFLLQIRKTVSGITETVALIPLTVSAGVLSSTPIADAEAASSAAASAASAAASAIATAADRVQTGLDRVATAADAVATAADRVQTGLDRVATAADVIATAADRVQTGLDRVATAADVVTAAASAAAALASQGAAATSASAAASSATTALNAIISTFKGGVAGASVPSTSTAAGDYYRITSAGTSQSKTWTIGDLAIYNGSSGSWTQIPAGFVDEARVLKGDAPRAIAKSIGFGPGLSTGNTAQILYNLGSNALGTSDFTWHIPMRVPSAISPGSIGWWSLGCMSDTTNGYNTNSLRPIFNGADMDIVRGASGTSRTKKNTGFRTTYAGQFGVLTIRRLAGVVEALWNGVKLTLTDTASAGAGVELWDSTLATPYFRVGAQADTIPYIPEAGKNELLNYGQSDSEVLAFAQTGRLTASDDLGTGRMTAQTSGVLTLGQRYRITAFVAGDSFTNVGAASNATGIEFVASGTTPTTWTNASSLIPLGQLFKTVFQPACCIALDGGTNKIYGVATTDVAVLGEKPEVIAIPIPAMTADGFILLDQIIVPTGYELFAATVERTAGASTGTITIRETSSGGTTVATGTLGTLVALTLSNVFSAANKKLHLTNSSWSSSTLTGRLLFRRYQ